MGSGGKGEDTVLFDTVSDRTIREGQLEKIGGTRQNWYAYLGFVSCIYVSTGKRGGLDYSSIVYFITKHRR